MNERMKHFILKGVGWRLTCANETRFDGGSNICVDVAAVEVDTGLSSLTIT